LIDSFFLLLCFLLLLDEFIKLRLGILAQFLGIVVLNTMSLIKNNYTVTVDDRVDSVRYREDSRVFEHSLHDLLNPLFSLDVDVGSSFIQDYNLVASQDSSADTNELLLTSTQTV